MKKNEISSQKQEWKKKKYKTWFFGFVSAFVLVLLVVGSYFFINYMVQNSAPKHPVEITLVGVKANTMPTNLLNGQDCKIIFSKNIEQLDYIIDIKLGDNRLFLGKDYSFNNETGTLFINGQSIIGNGEKLIISAKAVEVWNGLIENGYQSGNGDETNPYLISNGKQLAYLAQQVNNGEKYSGKYFKLTNDIYLNDETYVYDILNKKLIITNNQIIDFATIPNNSTQITTTNYWTPIGEGIIDDAYIGAPTIYGNVFSGTFDGDNHIISGIYINDDSTNLGLFGKSEGTIKNIGIVNSFINGMANTGAICGYMKKGNLEKCFNEGIVSGKTNIGGICGFIENNSISATSIKNCYNTGLILGTDLNFGGLFGKTNSIKIEKCYNKGIIKIENNSTNTGGIIGLATYTEILNCHNLGNISGDYIVGGLIGRHSSSTNIMTNCYNTGNVSGNNLVGGLSGVSGYANIKNCFNNGTITTKQDAGGIVSCLICESLIENCFNFGNVISTNNGGLICYVGGLCDTITDDSIVKNSYNLGNIQGIGNDINNIVGYYDTSDGKVINCYYYNSIGDNPITTNITADTTCLISYPSTTEVVQIIPRIDTTTLINKLNLNDNSFKLLIIERINNNWQLDGQIISLENYGIEEPTITNDGSKIIAFAFKKAVQ